MRTSETEISRQRQFIELVSSVSPDLEVDLHHSMQHLGLLNPIALRGKAGWLRRLISVGFKPKLRVAGRRGGPAWQVMFGYGRWEDLEIEVLDSRYFEHAERIAAEYEALSGESVHLVKKF